MERDETRRSTARDSAVRAANDSSSSSGSEERVQRTPARDTKVSQTQYGETWAYESIIGALPAVDFTERQAVVFQFALFEVGMVLLAWYYDLWNAALAGTAAITVAAVGSVAMLRLGEGTRALDVPDTYRRILFGSSIEVVLSVLAFIAFVTYLFVFQPRQPNATSLFVTLFGREPPILVIYLMLLVLWDLCYRIGTSWWTAVVALWRSYRYSFDPETTKALRRLDLTNVGFALVQALLLPFIRDEPVLLAVVGGHIVAVTFVSAVAIALLEKK